MKLKYLVVLLMLISLAACEREHRNTAGVKQVSGAPKYTQVASITATPAPTHVVEIAPTLEKAPIDGAALYVSSCGACHQATGQGIPGVFPPLVNSPYVIGENVERLAAIIVYGLQGPINVLGTEYNNAMAGFGAQFGDEELAAVATYIRSSWGHSAAAVSKEVFSETRKKWGSRGPFQISEIGGNE